MAVKWTMLGSLLGACSCDWGCPCSFDAPPTQGWCEGGYLWHIEEGKFGEVDLAGLSFAWLGRSPAAMHLGNVTGQTIIDDRATSEQRAALLALCEGKSGGPWVVFSAVTSTRLDPKFAPVEIAIDGLNSKATMGSYYALELGPILNPVTGEPEEIYLDKPTGFTAKRTTLGASRKFNVAVDIAFDHSGKYGEFSKFSYSGESST
jgi:hypothetical protein